MTDTNCYVYIYFRPCGTPLYVGMAGNARRWRQHQIQRTNPHLWNTLRKARREGLECPVVIFQHGLSWEDAQALEVLLIGIFGREDRAAGPLVNRTDGGDGVRGAVHTEATKALVGQRSVEMWADPEKRASLVAAQRAGKSTPEYRAKRSRISQEVGARPEFRLAQRQSKTAHFADPKNRAVTAAATKAAMATPEMRERLSAAQKLRYQDPAEREKLRSANLGRKASVETRAKRSASLKEAYATGRRKPATAEARAATAARNKARAVTPEIRERMRTSRLEFMKTAVFDEKTRSWKSPKKDS